MTSTNTRRKGSIALKKKVSGDNLTNSELGQGLEPVKVIMVIQRVSKGAGKGNVSTVANL